MLDRKGIIRKIRNQSDELFKFVIKLITDLHESDDLIVVEFSEKQIPNGSFKTARFRSKKSDYEFNFENTKLKIDDNDHYAYDVFIFNEFGTCVMSFTSPDSLNIDAFKLEDLFKNNNRGL